MTYNEIKQLLNKDKNNKKSNYISNLFSRTLVSVIVVLLSAIYINYSNKNFQKYKENLFEHSISFTRISKTYNKVFGQIIPIDIEKGTTKMVFDNKITYDSIEEYNNGYKLSLTNNLVTSLYDGIVVFIGEKEGYGNTVIVQGSNGVDIWYGNVTNVGVSLYDYIDKKSTIAEAKDNTLYLVFNRENEYLNYEEYLK